MMGERNKFGERVMGFFPLMFIRFSIHPISLPPHQLPPSSQTRTHPSHQTPKSLKMGLTKMCAKKKDLPLVTNGFELVFVFRVGLDAETGGQDELADCGAEAGEEGVEGLWRVRVLGFACGGKGVEKGEEGGEGG